MLPIKSGKSKVFLSVLLVVVLITLAGIYYLRTKTEKEAIQPAADLPVVDQTQVVVYAGPSVIESSKQVQVAVEGQELFVFETLVNHNRLFSFNAPTTTTPVALFDFAGSVQVTVELDEEVTGAIIRPLIADVQPSIKGNLISFRLDYPGNYTVEYNGNTERVLHLFANPLEEDIPNPENLPDDLIYIGPGVYKADAIPVRSNQTVYLAGGALVYGQIRAEKVENVTIRGRGILDGSIYGRTRAAEFTIPIEFRNSKNIVIEGISILNPAGWAISSYFVDGLTIENVKIITARANGDGISLQSSKNVLVQNSFIRSWDDSLVIKNYDRGSTSQVRVENCVLWTDLAQSMEIGYETYGEAIEDIVFKDISVLHNFHKPILSIHNSDDASIRNITFQDITVEDAQIVGDNPQANYDNFLLDFNIQYNQEWSKSGGERGEIKAVTVENMLVLAGRDDFVARIAGSDGEHIVADVTLRNITYKDRQVKTAADLNLSINEHTAGIKVEFKGKKSTGAAFRSTYSLNLSPDEDVQLRVVGQPEQIGYLVPQFAIKELPDLYMGQKIAGDFSVTATRGTSTREWDDGGGQFALEGNEPAYILDGDLGTKWQSADWLGETGEFAALSIWFDQDQKVGAIRIYGDPQASSYQLQNIAVFGVRSTSAKNVFTRILNSSDYEFSPASGNYADIKINPGEYSALQLRFYNKEGLAYVERPFAQAVEIYPASLTFNKSVSAPPHEDVYVASHITDGNPLTYYEAERGKWPVEIVVDLEELSDVQVVTVSLPPLLQWEPRVQVFSILASIDGQDFHEVVAEKAHEFDPSRGNVVEIGLAGAVQARFLKLIITSNDAGFGAQVSQISAYE